MEERMDFEGMDAEEIERVRRRRLRLQQMKREKERRLKQQRMIKTFGPIVLAGVVILVGGIVMLAHTVSARQKEERPSEITGESSVVQNEAVERNGEIAEAFTGDVSGADVSGNMVAADGKTLLNPVVSMKQYSAQETAQTTVPPGEVESGSVIFLERETGNILAQRDCHAKINPASMTKVLTLLVAAEHITDLDDTFTITIDITDYSYVNKCSNAGFDRDEEVTVRDLLYGTILPSGADAAVGLATYVAGSHEAFVDMMNEKAKILGIDSTSHFTNCVGLYDADHYCTAYDMAMIMEAALDNELCREVLSAHWYTTSSTPQHPNGLRICNLFLRRIEDKDTGGEVICAKTGFVVQSLNCAVSFGVSNKGKEYVCVTTGAQGAWKCIGDHVELYKAYENWG